MIMCAVPWPFYPICPAVLVIIEERFLLFFLPSSHDSITVDPVTITLYTGKRYTIFLRAVI
jgi:hypothetical protein